MILGDPALCHAQTSWKNTLKVLKEDGEGYYITPMADQQQGVEQGVIPKRFQQVQQEFVDVFHPPIGLPPKRDQDHAIRLKEGADIPNIRPYRYPHYQKNEIEKIVDEMLQAGIIQPSVSPFSSPEILVKKKDGGWRFCVDIGPSIRSLLPTYSP